MAAEIELKIRANAGLLTDVMMGKPEEFKDDDAGSASGSDAGSDAPPAATLGAASDAVKNAAEGD